MFNKGKIEELTARVQELEAENQRLSRLDVLGADELQKKADSLHLELSWLESQISEATATLQLAKAQIVEVEDTAILQEVGIYQFSHVLESAVAYQERLKELQGRIKAFNHSGGGAITATTNWTVNGSKRDGQRMVNEVSKLMLRAYNGEVDDAVRTLKPYKIDAAIDRLNKVRASIEKLGKTMSIQVNPAYHETRIAELRLTADFLQKQAEEKEAQKAERERLKEEAQAQQEFEAERNRLLKERTHHETVRQHAIDTGNDDAAENARQKLEEIAGAEKGLEERAANIRAGYVYVISNIGSFGEDVVKIGLTRRLEYEDRIHELSGASVPFVFDIHAVIYSDDAVTLEHQLHHELESLRMNRVNARKEFFRTTPVVVKDLLEKLAGNHLLVFNEAAEAAEWRISRGSAPLVGVAAAPESDPED